MHIKTVFSGFGGQGVLMMGYIYAHAAMNEGFNVTYLPAYGAEVRGGTANCTVAVADEDIASPIASEPEFAVVMNTPSLYAFQNKLAPRGGLFLNSSIIEARPNRRDIQVYAVPAGDLAEKVGNPRTLNTVIMGAFLGQTALISPDRYLKSLEELMGSKKKSIIEANHKAFAAGFAFMKPSE